MGVAAHLKEAAFRAAGRGLRIAVSARALDRIQGGKPRLQILVYHRVLPDEDPFAMSAVTCASFARQMALLRSRFHPLSLSEAADRLEAGDLRPGSVCVTFDDGYADNCRHAWPILRKYGIPATIYLATGLIGTGVVSWYDGVLALMRSSRTERLDYEPAGLRDVPIAQAGLRAAAAFKLLEWLKRFPPAERDAHIAALTLVLGQADAEKAMLDWDQVRSMHVGGISFGAHTVTHPILSLIGAREAEAEIAASRDAIQERLQAPVRHFAYPNGKREDYNSGTVEILGRLGFRTAVTTEQGVNDADTDRLQWKRRQPWETSVNSLYFRMLSERAAA
jgi:peptidoglycan/xylan/chitin deacetylase (PgdA/CDA1 family)